LPKHNRLFFVIPDLLFPFIAANLPGGLGALFFCLSARALRLCAANHALLTEMGGEHMSQQSSEFELKSLLLVFGL
jgi:hypothetical protein